MADNAKNENYEKAIQWATKYLEENVEPKQVNFKQGVIVLSDIDMVRTNLSRLIHAKGRAQQASYRAIREFKIYLSKNLT
jgi:lipopolysaccharide biosynthesis regulator YciM